jgi:hypothetical protein
MVKAFCPTDIPSAVTVIRSSWYAAVMSFTLLGRVVACTYFDAYQFCCFKL